jgi:hypothetical protein
MQQKNLLYLHLQFLLIEQVFVVVMYYCENYHLFRLNIDELDSNPVYNGFIVFINGGCA